MTSIEVWIAMNEDGDYEVAKDEDDVVDLCNENVGGLSRRLVRLRATCRYPTTGIAGSGTRAIGSSGKKGDLNFGKLPVGRNWRNCRLDCHNHHRATDL